MSTAPTLGDLWFQQRNWRAFDFQQQVWSAMAEGRSGLLHATTGSGKTYAIWLGALNNWARHSAVNEQKHPKTRLSVLWVTPMRALAADSFAALQKPLEELQIPWQVALRTGDTSTYQKNKQVRTPPDALVTTPESLALLLTRPDAKFFFGALKLVVVDEWHELLGNKRGVQLQLCLARLRLWHAQLMVWGMSATIANLDYAQQVLIPGSKNSQLIKAEVSKKPEITTLFPHSIDELPPYGHLGLTMLPYVIDEIAKENCNLLFTNTRSQCEFWYQAILDAKPEWSGEIALHHSALDTQVRSWVESALKDGKLRAVVCTSSLDLGVDFPPVDKVFQIGSPKGIARLLQRAGRSGHAPGRVSKITLVPTYALEYLESAAVQLAVKLHRIEPRYSPEKPLDLLVQHIVSMALAEPVDQDQFYLEITRAYAYRNLSNAEWRWCLAFLTHGGNSLTAYPEYHRVKASAGNLLEVSNNLLASRHRSTMGTIISESMVVVKFWSKAGRGKSLGSVEESFISRLKSGDHFVLAGRLLELVRLNQMIAYVRPGKGKQAVIPRWNSGRMPLSSELANSMIEKMDQAAQGILEGPEMAFLQPVLDKQKTLSALPGTDKLLIECWKSREGWHCFIFPFAGRSAHLGLASVMAWRLAKTPSTFSISVNDYGFELLSFKEINWQAVIDHELFSTVNLADDILQSLNAAELGRRKFREIAQISGLVFSGHPGAVKSAKQLQASSGLFFDVFKKYEPDHQLLAQAEREVLDNELELGRIEAALTKMQTMELNFQQTKRLSPFAFPLLADRIKETLTTEKFAERIKRMLESAGN